jgi:hypothetical protein
VRTDGGAVREDDVDPETLDVLDDDGMEHGTTEGW